jgi:hypothetical protein
LQIDAVIWKADNYRGNERKSSLISNRDMIKGMGGEIYTLCGNINERTQTVSLWFRVAFWKNGSTCKRRENDTHTLEILRDIMTWGDLSNIIVKHKRMNSVQENNLVFQDYITGVKAGRNVREPTLFYTVYYNTKHYFKNK